MKKIKTFLVIHKTNILLLITGLSLGALIMSLFIPKRIAPLKDGTYPIVSFGNFNITADEYYETLKSGTSIDYLLQMIDKKILDEKYETTPDMKKEVQIKMNDTIKEYTNYYQISENDFLKENGFEKEEDFYNLMLLEHKRSLYEKEYVKSIITNSEINNYYIKDLIPDMEIKYITGSETVLEQILSELKTKKIEEIVKKYNKKITYKDYSYVAFDNDINEDIYSEVLMLEENSYTDSLVSINGEYYIIFKGDVKEKANIDDIQKRIKEKLVQLKIDNDIYGELYQKALINLRNEYNITFNDTIFKDDYQDYLNDYK